MPDPTVCRSGRRTVRLASSVFAPLLLGAVSLEPGGAPAIGAVLTEVQSGTEGQADMVMPMNDRPTINTERVVLRWLDKSTARVDQIDVPVGQSVSLGGIDVLVRACRRTAPDQAPEDAAFLEISESRPGEAPQKIFQGWMFASSPSLSALEHPVYDVWVLDCADRFDSEADSADSEAENSSASQ
jgi:hypothetical protein